MTALLIIKLAQAQTNTNLIIMHHPITKSSICWWDTRASLLFSHLTQGCSFHILCEINANWWTIVDQMMKNKIIFKWVVLTNCTITENLTNQRANFSEYPNPMVTNLKHTFSKTWYAATHIYSQEQSNLAQHRSFLYALQLKTSISLLQDIICTFLESALTIFTMLNYPAQHRHLRSDHIKCPYNCQNR